MSQSWRMRLYARFLSYRLDLRPRLRRERSQGGEVFPLKPVCSEFAV